MKKTLLICFLALLCLAGSETQAKVASPRDSLVDNPGPRGQEESIPSAREGEETALIYGELINPDSLGPLTLDLQNGLISGNLSLENETIPISLTPGTFFDGVLDPRVRKFLIRIPISGDLASFRLKLGERVVLKDMLISPGDSVMVGIDLQNHSIVFGGPSAEWFEAQFAVQRATSSRIFQSPRGLLEKDSAILLDQNDNRQQWESQNREFGARLAIYEFGKSGLDQVKKELYKDGKDMPEWVALQNFKPELSQAQLGLLESRILGSFYSQNLGLLRQYHYGMTKAFGDSLGMNRTLSVLPEVLDKLDRDLTYVLARGKSPEALQFAREWVLTSRILNPLPYPQLVSEKFQRLTRDRLLMGHLIKKLSTEEIPEEQWAFIGAQLNDPKFKEEFEALRRVFQTGKALDPLSLKDLQGNEVAFGDFKGKPALVYFYFTGCANSANYFRNYLWPFYKNEAESKGVQLIAISVDKDPELWKSYLSEYSDQDIDNLNALGPSAQEWLSHYRISAYPRTLLLDSEGKVLAYTLGGENYDQYRDRILFLLESKHLFLILHFKPKSNEQNFIHRAFPLAGSKRFGQTERKSPGQRNCLTIQ